MRKTIAVLLIAAGSAAHAAPQDDMEKLLAQKGFASRIGDTISQATDRAADLVLNAMGSLGVPYRMGGTSADSGFDCSGFVRAMFKQTVGLMLPRTAAEQAATTARIEKTDLKPGDLVFFNTLRREFSHVGIYVGDGKFIHSPRSGSHVRVESMNISYWQNRFNGARRVLTSEQQAASASPSSPSSSLRVINRDSPAPTTVRLGGNLFGGSSSAAPVEMPAAGDSI